MIPIEPFRALRPSAARAREFSVPRLDHLSDAERVAIAGRLPRSLAAVLAEGGAELLAELERSKALLRQAEPTFYMHRQVRGSQRCVGLVACVPASAFQSGVVRAHRRACPGRAGAWKAQVGRLGAQVDPIVVGFEPTESVLDLFEREMNDRPLFHVVADDGATHTLWAGTRAPALQQAFREVARAYLLEGHHRAEASGAASLPAVLVPLDQVAPRWAARVLSGADGRRARDWIAGHGVAETDPGAPADGMAHACVVDADGSRRWMAIALPEGPGVADERLDALLLGGPGVEGRRQPGLMGPDGVEALLGAVGGGVAFLIGPPTIAEIMRIADTGARLPVASTWFEPRIRSGLWIA